MQKYKRSRAGYVFFLFLNRWCPLRAACYMTIIKTSQLLWRTDRGPNLFLGFKAQHYTRKIWVQSLSATTNYLYTIQVITGSGQGLQTVLITSLCNKDPPALAGSTQAGQLKYPWRQGSPGPTSARNGKPVTAQACQLLPVAVRTAWEFIMLVTSSASCIHTSLLPE